MNLFLLLVDPDGGPVPEEARRRYERARCCAELDLVWQDAGSAAVLLGRDDLARAGFGPSVARWETYLAAGNVRLDNRPDVARWAGYRDLGRADTSDLDLVVRAVARRGEGAIADILGDFAFAIWDSATRRVVVARDAFGVKRLCYRDDPHLLAFASRAELLADGEDYDVHALAERAAACTPSPDRTVYAGVSALPAGHVAVVGCHGLRISQFWAAESFEPVSEPRGMAVELSQQFRALFAESVRLRLTGAADVWSEVSGGLDSSSVASTAQWLTERGEVSQGVSGTISWVYRWSTDGDEREFSNAVVQRWGLRNEVMLDNWYWEDDGVGPPISDEPFPGYPMYARHRRIRRVIRDAGGHVLLTGFGSDHYLLGNMFFFADWLVAGRQREALREMLRRAVLGRVSFWNLAYQNALLPLFPTGLHSTLVPTEGLPAWIPRGVAERFDLESGARTSGYGGKWGHKYAALVLDGMKAIPSTLNRHAVLEDELELRHPFLYRPLVEFGLRLPPEMCVQPHARKWILRQAMDGILPEIVRRRVGKGADVGCAFQSLVHERRILEPALTQPILAELGCVDAVRLRAAYADACRTGAPNLVNSVGYTLMVETWLRARSGRWPARTCNTIEINPQS